MMYPNIVEDMDIEEYHDPKLGLSSSGVKLILDCPRRYYFEYFEKRIQDCKKLNDKFKTGRAVHMLALEPKKFHDNFYVITEQINLTTKTGKAIYAEAEDKAKGREILRCGEWDDTMFMANSIKEHSIWKYFVNGKVEHSIFWKGGLFNTSLKARPDIFNDDVIIDLKTTDSIANFGKSIHNYGYHRQAAMQIDGLHLIDGRQRHFAFFVVEKKAPYLTSIFELDPTSIQFGRTQYLEAASIYSECLESNKWPGYVEEPQLISLPSYAVKEELEINE